MDLEKMINWDLVDDDDVVGAYVDDDSISFIKSAPKFEEGADFRYIKRPRKFEDGAFYPVIFRRSRTTNVAQYNAKHCSFSVKNVAFHKDFFSFIGEKLPDSLWSE